jgi:hypothetical protein
LNLEPTEKNIADATNYVRENHEEWAAKITEHFTQNLKLMFEIAVRLTLGAGNLLAEQDALQRHVGKAEPVDPKMVDRLVDLLKPIIKQRLPTRKAGAPGGGQNKPKDTGVIRLAHELAILKAMLRLMHKGYNKELNPSVIAKEMSKSRSTIYNWMNQGLEDIEVLDIIAHSMHTRGINEGQVNEKLLSSYKQEWRA